MAKQQSEERGALQLYANAPPDELAPKWDLVGPTANDDIRRAVSRYGAEAVKSAVKEATKAKLGRKRMRDWPELREIIEVDARAWLAGEDPFAARSNYAIAKMFAERNPGHSVISTHKRIERKLSQRPFDRRWYTIVAAESLSRDDFPYAAHIRALSALAELPEPAGSVMWRTWLAEALSTLADYEAREGHPPVCKMTFLQVEEAVKQGGVAALTAANQQNVFGSILANAVNRSLT